MKYATIAILVLIFLIVAPVSAQTWCGAPDLFFWSTNDTIDEYRVMQNYPQLTDQVTLISPSVSSTTGQKTLGTWITPENSIYPMTLDPGLWRFRVYAKASSDAGLTQIQFHAINRSSDGTETDLFYGQAIILDIDKTITPSEYLLSYARRNATTFFPGDRLMIRANVSTDSAAERTVSMDVAGNTNASMVSISYFDCTPPTPAPTIPNLPAGAIDQGVPWWTWIVLILLIMIAFTRLT